MEGIAHLLHYYLVELAVVLAGGAVLGMAIERFVETSRRAKRRQYWQHKNNGGNRSRNDAEFKKLLRQEVGKSATLDASDQLRIVMNADFGRRTLLNQSERRVFAHLDRILAEERPGWRAMCQVSLGEIISSKDKAAYLAVNSKRVDFLIVDESCTPLQAIEFQGTGHYQGTAAARDAVKREALRRAGIQYHEIASGDTPGELRTAIRKLAGRVVVD